MNGAKPVFRLLDVGTGLGLNLAAALEALDGTGVDLEAMSLEHDTSVIRAGLELYGSGLEMCGGRADDRSGAGPADARVALPVNLERWHAPVRRALRSALPQASESSDSSPHSSVARLLAPSTAVGEERLDVPRGTLDLVIGDARDTLAGLPIGLRFDAVFLDPFSPAVEPELWDLAFLSEAARRMSAGSLLSTYTASLAVRARLCAAGLNVGPGERVGRKAFGTIACRDGAVGAFDARTARRIEKRAAALLAASDRNPSRPSVSARALI
jgi:hypothetical protein